MEQQQQQQAAVATGEGSLLDAIIENGRMARNEYQRDAARDIISAFVNQIVDGSMKVERDLIAMVNRRIAEIDRLVSQQLDAILHHPDIQRLESAWRGLHYLVMNTETSSSLKIKVFPISKKELFNDLDRAAEFDQSTMFKKIYEEEFGTLGGSPYSLLIGDYQFGRHPQDIALLEKIASVAAAAHAPFITSPAPELFDMDSWQQLSDPRDLSKIFESNELIKWRSLRESDDSRYVVMALPRILMRLPYGPDTVPVEDFNYVENVTGTDHHKYCWGNAAYALGRCITKAFAEYGWPAAIRGIEGGGLVEGLPVHTFPTDDGDIAIKCPTEIAIGDRREKELSDLGFMALCYSKNSDYAAFFGGQTIQKPKKYDDPDATANAKLSTQLPFILVASRFAHYLKAIMRDKIGSFQSRGNVESFLNRWISQYVNNMQDAGPEIKARYPLYEARVDVVEQAGKPGEYQAIAYLRPHFQLEGLTASLRLVAKLPKGAS
ncbi:MAG: type VI secretion system contractile sheath large subunit [Chlorobi bacterium]|jgi:type VI secretion system protein ImpC|nr:type VI secretion system contractile sheath large subunit [Chlorobiota bacterium]